MTEKRNKTRNVPNLRFQFDEEWVAKTLGEVVVFKTTNSFSRDNLNYEKGVVKNIHYGDIHTKFRTLFDITKEIVPFVNEKISIKKISKDYYCQEGDIVFADASEDLNDVGKSIEIVNLNNEKLLAGLHTLLARPKKNYFQIGFAGYLFKSKNIRTQIQKEAQGTKVLSISSTRISNLKLDFPSIPEQQKVTSFLSLIDERIQTQSKVIAQLKSLMQSLREMIFKQQLQFKDDFGNNFPNWEVKKLRDIFSISAGGDIQKINTSKIQTKIFKYPIYANSEEKKGLYGYSDLYKVEENTITVTGRGNIGIAIGRNHKYYPIVRLLVLKPKLEVSIIFFENQINLLNIYKESTGVPQLTAPQISTYFVKVPCLDEQLKIAKFLSSFDEKINAEKQLLQQYENQKKYLLQNLFI